MIFYKTAGALMLLISGVFVAVQLNGRLVRVREQSGAIEEWLRFLRGQIDCFSMPVADILSLGGCEILWRCGYRSDVVPRSFEELLTGSEIYDGDIESALRELGASFGGCYREEQLRACDRCIAVVEKRHREISDELPKKKKLNTTLSVSAALALAILLV